MVALLALTGLSALLGEQLSPGVIWVWSAVAQDQLQMLWYKISSGQRETLIIFAPIFLREIGLKFSFFVGSLCGLGIKVIVAS